MEIILDTQFNNPSLPVRPPARFYDDFTGGGGDYTSLGVTQEGRTWQYPAGQGWFQRKDATATGSGRSELAVVEGMSPDGILAARIALESRQDHRYGLAIRVQSSTGFFWLSQNNGGTALTLYERHGTSNTTLASAPVTLSTGDLLEARFEGNEIQGWVNGVHVLTGTSDSYRTATRHGLFNGQFGSTTANPRWDWVRFSG